jgi:hypothetical protein
MRTRTWRTKYVVHVAGLFLSALLMAGCAGNYGSYKLDSGVLQSFKENRVPSDYNYFYYGFDTNPYALIGVEKKYDAGSNLWREVDPNTEKFRNMVGWMWGDYGYSPFAAQILDPSGTPVGVLYTSIREIGIKFSGDNRIIVMPNTPFLWGPAVNTSPAGRYYGSINSDRESIDFRQASNP